MEGIYAYIRNIGFFMVFSAVVRLIAPRGSFRDYINLFLGLVFTVVMLNPISLFLKTDLPELRDYIMKNGATAAEVFKADDWESSDIVYEEYKKMTEERIGELCAGYMEDAEVSVSVGEGFDVCDIYIEGKILKDCGELKSLVSKLYGISEEKIVTAGEWEE